MGSILNWAFIFLVCTQSSVGLGATERERPVCSLLAASKISEYSAEDLRHPEKEFVHDTSKYVLKAERNQFIRNQCAYGSCWAHSTLSLYENRAARAGVSIRLSEDYFIVSQLIEKSENFLKHKEASQKPGDEKKSKYGKNSKTKSKVEVAPPYVTQGYPVSQVEALIVKYGLVPEGAWKARTKFSDESTVGKRMILHLNFLLTQLREQMNTRTNPMSFETAREAVVKFLESYTGPFPKRFSFGMENHTPLSFARKTIFAPFPEGKRVKLEIQQNAQIAFEAIRNQLDKTGEPVLLSVQWTQTFVDHSRGVMSIAAFNHFGVDPKKLIAIAKETSDSGAGGHAVNIVDYEVDAQGNPVKFLILNSHGAMKGDGGYYHIYWDYLKHMGNRVLVYENFVPSKPAPGMPERR